MLFSGLNCFILLCKSIRDLLVLTSVLCSPMERGNLPFQEPKYLLPGIELENKYIFISNLCVVLFSFLFFP